jgi:hypothetical protein
MLNPKDFKPMSFVQCTIAHYVPDNKTISTVGVVIVMEDYRSMFYIHDFLQEIGLQIFPPRDDAQYLLVEDSIINGRIINLAPDVFLVYIYTMLPRRPLSVWDTLGKQLGYGGRFLTHRLDI